MKYSSTLFSMPRPAFTRRKPMPAENRAAQFAPFAALTGYEEEIREVCNLFNLFVPCKQAHIKVFKGLLSHKL